MGTVGRIIWVIVLAFALIGLGYGFTAYAAVRMEQTRDAPTKEASKSGQLDVNGLVAACMLIGFSLGLLFNNLIAGVILGIGLGLLTHELLRGAREGRGQ